MRFLKSSDPRGAVLLSPAVLVGSVGLSGFAPVMRGTSGSIATAVVAYALLAAGLPTPLMWWALAGVTTALSLWAGDVVVKRLKRDDPGWFVMDEAAGLFLTLAIVGAESLLAIVGALVLFRAYDIVKPWPVKSFERLKGTWGILADDLAAGVLAAWTYLVMLVLMEAVTLGI
jgi:phosphatidylglycerophosphatase A